MTLQTRVVCVLRKCADYLEGNLNRKEKAKKGHEVPKKELSHEDEIIEQLANFSGVSAPEGWRAGGIGLGLAILGVVIVLVSRLLTNGAPAGYLVGGVALALLSIGIVGLYAFRVDFETEEKYRELVDKLTHGPKPPPSLSYPPDAGPSHEWINFFNDQLDRWNKVLQALVSVAGLAPLSSLLQTNVSFQAWYFLVPLVIILIIVAIVTPALWYLPRVIRGRRAITCLMVLTLAGDLSSDEAVGRAFLRITSP